MKLLSLWQPHASAMALGLKTIETRGKRTHYRGLVAIHAVKKWDGEILGIIDALPKRIMNPICDAHWILGSGLPRGCIVAIGNLVDCLGTNWQHPRDVNVVPLIFQQYPQRDTPVERALGNYEPGRYGWVFDDIKPLKDPLPYVGSQCMLDLSAITEREIMRRVG